MNEDMNQILRSIGLIFFSGLFNPVLVVASLAVGVRIRRVGYIPLFAAAISLASVIFGIFRSSVVLNQSDAVAYAVTMLANTITSVAIMFFMYFCTGILGLRRKR